MHCGQYPRCKVAASDKCVCANCGFSYCSAACRTSHQCAHEETVLYDLLGNYPYFRNVINNYCTARLAAQGRGVAIVTMNALWEWANPTPHPDWCRRLRLEYETDFEHCYTGDPEFAADYARLDETGCIDGEPKIVFCFLAPDCPAVPVIAPRAPVDHPEPFCSEETVKWLYDPALE